MTEPFKASHFAVPREGIFEVTSTIILLDGTATTERWQETRPIVFEPYKPPTFLQRINAAVRAFKDCR